MREIRTSGSEGGGVTSSVTSSPYPYQYAAGFAGYACFRWLQSNPLPQPL
jgi:hypothetical protein